jgi:hypothetical protein
MTPPGLQRYVEFMTGLTPARLAELPAIVTDDMHFRDPFNDVVGRAHFGRCLEDMLHQLADLEIDVTHTAPLTPRRGADAQARHALWWRFSGRLVRFGGRHWEVTGMAVVTLAADGRVAEHLDYWDAAGGLYEELPLIGALMRWIRRRLAVD